MHHYCTLFDKNYLLFGLGLHHSLMRLGRPFRLHILAMDPVCEQALVRLALPNVQVVSLSSVITEKYDFVHQKMHFGQICWTCQPLLCKYLLDREGLEGVTYLEADSYFFSDPEPLFEEIGSRSVSLVPHNYVEGYDHAAMSGIYCVQFNYFRNDAAARELLASWETACLSYDRARPKSFPGQTCLDTWPGGSSAVRVIENPGAGVAPWNEARFRIHSEDGRPMIDDRPVVFYHFHELSVIDDESFFSSSYHLSREVLRVVYEPYVEQLRILRAGLRAVVPGFEHCKSFRSPGLWKTLTAGNSDAWRAYLKHYYCLYRGRQNILHLPAQTLALAAPLTVAASSSDERA
jgi:hypothetical protein